MKPQWLVLKEKEAAKTGILDLSKEFITDLTLIKASRSIKVLNLSYSPIESLEGLHKLPNIEKFIANNAAISSLKGFEAISKIQSIELRETPISKEKYYKLSLVVAFKNIRTIDNKRIPDSLYKKAETYPKEAADLLNNGWRLEYPCPSLEQLESLQEQNEILNTPMKEAKREQTEDNMTDEFTKIMRDVINKHDKALEKTDKKLQKLFDSNPDLSEEVESVPSSPASHITQQEEPSSFTDLTESSIYSKPKPVKELIAELLEQYGYQIRSLSSSYLLDLIRQILAAAAAKQSTRITEMDIPEEEEEDSLQFEDIPQKLPQKSAQKSIIIEPKQQQKMVQEKEPKSVPVLEDDLIHEEEEEIKPSPQTMSIEEEEVSEIRSSQIQAEEEEANENVTYVFGEEEDSNEFAEEDINIESRLSALASRITEVNSLIAALAEEDLNEEEQGTTSF